MTTDRGCEHVRGGRAQAFDVDHRRVHLESFPVFGHGLVRNLHYFVACYEFGNG
jgi:hypothetical protein